MFQETFLCIVTSGRWFSSYEAVFDENNFTRYRPDKFKYAFDGFIEWRCVKAHTEGVSGTTGALAAERVRGFLYDDADTVDVERHFHFCCVGYRIVEPPNTPVIGNDGYDVLMDPNAEVEFRTYSFNNGEWDGKMDMKRVATQSELIELLEDKFGGIGDIVKIIADLLHYFKYPDADRVKQRRLKILLDKVEKREPRIKELFCDDEK